MEISAQAFGGGPVAQTLVCGVPSVLAEFPAGVLPSSGQNSTGWRLRHSEVRLWRMLQLAERLLRVQDG